MTPAAVIGIDPGKEGGVALVPLDRVSFAPWVLPIPYLRDDDQPDIPRLVSALYMGALEVDVAVLALEDVNSFGMGRQSAFVFGQGIGALLAMAAVMRTPVVRVRPVVWQKPLGVRRGRAKKADASGPVSRLFPGVELFLGASRPHSGVVDALGIAEYARRLATGYGSGHS